MRGNLLTDPEKPRPAVAKVGAKGLWWMRMFFVTISISLFTCNLSGQVNIIPVRTDVSGFTSWTDVSVAGTTYLQLLTATSVTITPAMDFDSYTGEALNFKARTYGGVNATENEITVSISTDNGSSWTVLGTRTPTTTTLTAMTPFDLSSYNGTQVKVKFSVAGTLVGVGAGIDDISITGYLSCTPPSDPTGTITPAANPACGSTTLTYSGASANIYWQTSATGTSTTYPTTSAYTVSSSGTYYVRAYNGSCWSTNSLASASITINTTPAITTQPSNQTVTEPATATFSVVATSAASYQWQESTDGGSTWSNISGATSASYTTGATSTFMSGYQYQCIVSGSAPCASVTSSAATLTVNASGGGAGCATDLIISEYVEGSSSNKYIEIYNGTGASVDLSDYKLQLYANGASSPTNDVTLSGTLANGAVIVYQNSSATLYSGTNNTAINFNGNDAVALYKISTSSFVDIFGRIGEDPGTAWTSGSYSTLDKTLVRNADVVAGVSSNPASGFPTLATEWTLYSIDDASHLGSHTMSCGPMIAVSPVSLDFGEVCVNATSGEVTYTVSGTNLTDDIVITPPSNFEISLTSGSGYVVAPSYITLTPTGGVVNSTTIYVVFKPTAVQAYSGSITHTSTGATARDVTVAGTGVSLSTITSQPLDQSVADGVNASFSVIATNAATYQWQENQSGSWNDLSDVSPYSGVATSTLLISPATNAMTGYQYRCIITSSCSGSVTSDAADLTVSPPSNYCLDEDFVSGTLPAGWTQTSVIFTSYYAEFGASNGELATLAVSTPVTLTFDLARTTNTTAKTLYVEVSTTTQSGTYTTVATYDHSNTTSGGTTLCTVDLSAYSGYGTVYIKFRKSSSTTSPWRLDNIKLNCTVVPNTITTGVVSTTPFSVSCSAGATGTVTFTSTDVFNSGNTYTAQLSNASGQFISPVNIGSIVSTANSGTINITIPPGMATGTGYMIRVISNSPSVIGSSSTAFSINLSGGPCSCYEIESILVDACGAGNVEGENEMFRFVVGAADLNTSDITVDWPNNPWLGICQDANSAAVVSAINATVSPPGQLVEPIGGVIPAGSQVMFFTSTDFNYGMFDFSALNYTLYAVFQCPGNTEGHFGNYTSSGDKTLLFTCGSCVTESVTYNAGLLYHGDGATVDFDVPGNPTYSDSGECSSVPIFELPIDLLFFKASCSDEDVQLYWATASEFNNSYFTIEGGDESGYFRPVAIVQGSGTSNERVDYSLNVDKNSKYFRIKQTDYNGKFTYSNIISVDCDENQIQLFPTLASEGESITILGEVSSIRVFDGIGREIFPVIQRNKVGGLEQGIYFFVINNKWNYKIVVQ